MNRRTHHPHHAHRAHRAGIAGWLALTLVVLATALTSVAPPADAGFAKRCERQPRACERVQSWVNVQRHRFKAHDMPRTPDRRIRALRAYYKAAWYDRYGGATALHRGDRREHEREGRVLAVHTPYGICSGWGDCFDLFVDAANCSAHPVVTATCLTSDVLDDGIGKPEKAELVCGGAVLVTSGGNPVAVGRGIGACYWTWLAWQIFG